MWHLGGEVMSPETHLLWLVTNDWHPGPPTLAALCAVWLLPSGSYSHFWLNHSSSPRRVFSLWSIITSNGLCNWMSIRYWRLLMDLAQQDLKKLREGEGVVWGWVWHGSEGTHLLDFCSHLLKQIRNKGSSQFTKAWIINKNLFLVTMLNENRRKFLAGKKACCVSYYRSKLSLDLRFFLMICHGH